MERLCYSSLDLAAIIRSMNLGCQSQADLLEQIWENERPFLQEKYRDNKRRLILDTYFKMTYLSDKPAIDAEFPYIRSDIRRNGGDLLEKDYIIDDSGLDLFFKSARLRILYGGGRPYVRVKRRTLMSHYGYKRITPQLIEYFNQCISFYHLQSYARGGVKCRIEDVGIDKMIMFRVV